MSALDLFASGMGAFVLIALIALPYYLKTDPDLRTKLQNMQDRVAQLEQKLADSQNQNSALEQQLEQLRRELENARQQIEELESSESAAAALRQQLEQLQAALQDCEEQLNQTFLAIVIKWAENHDVDLHVLDPAGRHYYFKKKSHPGSNAILSIDARQGPGIEIWEYSEAQPGQYKIFYHLYALKSGGTSATVKGTLFYRGGSKKFPDKTIYKTDKPIYFATLTLGADGRVRVDY